LSHSCWHRGRRQLPGLIVFEFDCDLYQRHAVVLQTQEKRPTEPPSEFSANCQATLGQPRLEAYLAKFFPVNFRASGDQQVGRGVCVFMIPLAHTESRATEGSGAAARSESAAPFTRVLHNLSERAHCTMLAAGPRERPGVRFVLAHVPFMGLVYLWFVRLLGAGKQGFCFCTSDRGMVSHTQQSPRPTRPRSRASGDDGGRGGRGEPSVLCEAAGRRSAAEETQPRGPKQPGGSGARRCTEFHRRRQRRAERASSDRAERAPCIYSAERGLFEWLSQQGSR
jgi:hypothetical protein